MSHFEAKTSDGTPSGMFYGFVSTIQSLKKKYRQYKFIVVWDHTPKHKYDLMPSYKSGRTKLPDKIFNQIDKIKEILQGLCVDQYEKEGQEADDVIASIVEGFKSDEGTENILVYTNDKDMLQLVEDGKVVVFKPKVGIHPEKFYDEEAVKERFGVRPQDLAVFRSFDGDESDSIKGLFRVRRTVIVGLVRQYKDINTILDSLDSVKLTENERNKILSFKENAEINYKIIALDRHLTDIKVIKGAKNECSVRKLLDEYEIKKIKCDLIADLFSSSLNIRYSDPRPVVEIESYSLFD